jgi:hypothetical protein
VNDGSGSDSESEEQTATSSEALEDDSGPDDNTGLKNSAGFDSSEAGSNDDEDRSGSSSDELGLDVGGLRLNDDTRFKVDGFDGGKLEPESRSNASDNGGDDGEDNSSDWVTESASGYSESDDDGKSEPESQSGLEEEDRVLGALGAAKEAGNAYQFLLFEEAEEKEIRII